MLVTDFLILKIVLFHFLSLDTYTQPLHINSKAFASIIVKLNWLIPQSIVQYLIKKNTKKHTHIQIYLYSRRLVLMLDFSFFGVHRSNRKFFTHVETFPRRVKDCKCWPMLGTWHMYGHWAERVFELFTPNVTRGIR